MKNRLAFEDWASAAGFLPGLAPGWKANPCPPGV